MAAIHPPVEYAGSMARDCGIYRTKRRTEEASLEVCRSGSVHLEAYLVVLMSLIGRGMCPYHISTLEQTICPERRNAARLNSLVYIFFVWLAAFSIFCSAPESNLELQWAFGFNSTAGRGAVHYTAKGNFVVGAGSAGVVTHQV